MLSCLDLSFSDIEMFSKFFSFCVWWFFWEPLKLLGFGNTCSASSVSWVFLHARDSSQKNLTYFSYILVARKNLGYWHAAWRNHCVFFQILKINSAKNLLYPRQQTNLTKPNVTHIKPRHSFTNPKRLVGEESFMCLESGDKLV